jgi:four helix bundle protein
MRHYERLVAWRECHELALRVYRETQRFPKSELYGLTSQARRAAFSAAVNIVEGSAKRGSREFRRYLDTSLGSLSELGYTLQFARDLEFLPTEVAADLDRHQARARFLTWKLYVAVTKAARSQP